MLDPFAHSWKFADPTTAECGVRRAADTAPEAWSQQKQELRDVPVTCPDCIATKGLAAHFYKQDHQDWLDEMGGGQWLR